MMPVINILRRLDLYSTERPGRLASNSEKVRWIKNGAVEVRGKDIVLFPKSKRKTTLGPVSEDNALCREWNKIFEP